MDYIVTFTTRRNGTDFSVAQAEDKPIRTAKRLLDWCREQGFRQQDLKHVSACRHLQVGERLMFAFPYGTMSWELCITAVDGDMPANVEILNNHHYGIQYTVDNMIEGYQYWNGHAYISQDGTASLWRMEVQLEPRDNLFIEHHNDMQSWQKLAVSLLGAAGFRTHKILSLAEYLDRHVK